jgi:hypothetical protein
MAPYGESALRAARDGQKKRHDLSIMPPPTSDTRA